MPKTVFSLALAALLLAGAAGAHDLEARRQALQERFAELEKNPEEWSESERLARFIDLYFEYAMLEFPEYGTYIGLPGSNHRWSDQSLAASQRRRSELADGVLVLQGIDRSKLEGEDRLNYDLLSQSMSEMVEAQRFHDDYLAISQLGGVHQNVSQMFMMMPTATVPQYEDILARLRGVPTLVEHTLERLEKGLEKGVTPPRVTLRDVPTQVTNLLPEEPLASPLLMPFARFPASIPEPEQERLRAEAVRLFQEEVAPAYRRLHSYLVETYLPGSRQTTAMGDLPDGPEWYAFRVRQMTTTDLSPRQIHEIGLSEVARIRGEMEKIVEETGFEGELEAFFEYLRTDPKFFFEDPEELLAAYRDIAKRADPELVRLFGTLPRTPYGVRAVPPHAEKSQTTAYYTPGSLEAGRPAWVYANTYALDTRPKWEMEALTLHEGVPGHHLQIALAQEMEELPWFRRFGGYTAYVEGWGLYAESLGEEMGFYQDPYSKFGQLTYEMWRAIRLVVDTGMHALGWSRQQAIDFFIDNAGKSEHDIVVEVDRYIVWPGQALAYKIGELKIKELRAHAEEELGEDFDIRAFHDQVLGNGALPLSVLETHVREWVAAQRPEAPADLQLGAATAGGTGEGL
jgi:uncharacterized protein (DUF885 family)